MRTLYHIADIYFEKFSLQPTSNGFLSTKGTERFCVDLSKTFHCNLCLSLEFTTEERSFERKLVTKWYIYRYNEQKKKKKKRKTINFTIQFIPTNVPIDRILQRINIKQKIILVQIFESYTYENSTCKYFLPERIISKR